VFIASTNSWKGWRRSIVEAEETSSSCWFRSDTYSHYKWQHSSWSQGTFIVVELLKNLFGQAPLKNDFKLW